MSLTPLSIRLQLLGSAALTGPDGREIGGPLAQPRRLALLAYLCLVQPSGYLRRDRLLPLFWPELDASRARAALSQALYVLRRAIGEAALPSRGAEEVAADPDLLWCDAAEIGRRLDAGQLAEAVAAYSADLLPGFHLDEAPEFERWLERARRELRERVTRAANQLAATAATPSEALPWARRALELAPHDESALRQLVLRLEQVGDRAGALAAYQGFVSRLRDELELTPSPETAALAERIRSAPAPSPTAQPLSNVPPEAVATSRPGDVATPGPGDQATSRAPTIIIALVLAVLAGIAYLGQRHTTPANPHERVVILPFVVRGDSGYAWLGEGMVDLLSTGIEGLDRLRTVDPTAVLSWDAAQDGGNDLERGRAARQHFDADLFVLGSVTAAGRGLELRVTLYGSDGQPATTLVGRVANEDALFGVVDSLAGSLVAARLEGPADRLDRVALVSTGGVALRAYLDGERLYRGGRYADAAQAFSRAIAADSGFALAWYRLSVAARWADAGIDPDQAADHAFMLARQLPPRDRRLLEAYNEYIRPSGEADEAERRLRAIVTEYPDDAEGWFWLGEVLFHTNPERGRPILEAREPFRRAARLEPGGTEALGHLVYLAAYAADRPELDSLLTQVLARIPAAGGHRAQFVVMVEALSADSLRWRRVIDSLRRTPGPGLAQSILPLMPFEATLPRAADLARALAEPGRSRADRVLGAALEAHIALARGNWTATGQALERLAAVDPSGAEAMRAYFSAMPWLPLSREARLSARTRIGRWTVATGAANSLVLTNATDRDGLALQRFYGEALGRLAGDSGAGSADSIGPVDSSQLLRLETVARGLDALLARDTSRALALLLPPPVLRVGETVGHEMYFNNGYERWLRADALAAAGRLEESINWYRGFEIWAGVDVIMLAASLVRRGELFERLGRPDSARVAYSRALDLWSGSDALLAPLVRSTRARLTALDAGR